MLVPFVSCFLVTLVDSLYAQGRLSSTLYLIYPCAFIYKKKKVALFGYMNFLK